MDDQKKRQEVWRRYSEFEALRNFLVAVYPHIVVPPLPEKAVCTYMYHYMLDINITREMHVIFWGEPEVHTICIKAIILYTMYMTLYIFL